MPTLNSSITDVSISLTSSPEIHCNDILQSGFSSQIIGIQNVSGSEHTTHSIASIPREIVQSRIASHLSFKDYINFGMALFNTNHELPSPAEMKNSLLEGHVRGSIKAEYEKRMVEKVFSNLSTDQLTIMKNMSAKRVSEMRGGGMTINLGRSLPTAFKDVFDQVISTLSFISEKDQLGVATLVCGSDRFDLSFTLGKCMEFGDEGFLKLPPPPISISADTFANNMLGAYAKSDGVSKAIFATALKNGFDAMPDSMPKPDAQRIINVVKQFLLS